jgi:hypothetical protein
MPSPEIIGTLAGKNVTLDRDTKSLVIESERPIRFHIDHPYIQGTKLEREARAALRRSSSLMIDTGPTEPACMYSDNGKITAADTCLKCGVMDGQDCKEI